MVQGGGLPPGPAEGGRRPLGDGPGVADGKAKQFSTWRKVESVLRPLAGKTWSCSPESWASPWPNAVR